MIIVEKIASKSTKMKFVLFVILCAVQFLLFGIAKAEVQGCKCTLLVTSDVPLFGCEINDETVLQLNSRIVIEDIIAAVDMGRCSIGSLILSQYSENFGEEIIVDQESCPLVSFSGDEQAHHYSLECELTEDDPEIAGELQPEPDAAPAADAAAGARAGKGKTDDKVVKLINPLGGTFEKPEGISDNPKALNRLYGRVISYAIRILGSVVLLVFIYGGFLWLTSGGSPERVKKGMQTMLWASIGLLIIASSYVILKTIIDAILGVGL